MVVAVDVVDDCRTRSWAFFSILETCGGCLLAPLASSHSRGGGCTFHHVKIVCVCVCVWLWGASCGEKRHALFGCPPQKKKDKRVVLVV